MKLNEHSLYCGGVGGLKVPPYNFIIFIIHMYVFDAGGYYTAGKNMATGL